MMKRLFKKNNENGFTLAELLIVVAIIAVLVAISIPIFTTQLEKAREATDAANIRAQYAEMMSEVLVGDYDITKDGTEYVVNLKQTKSDWQNNEMKKGLAEAGMVLTGEPKKAGTATLTYTDPGNGTAGTVTVTFSN